MDLQSRANFLYTTYPNTTSYTYTELEELYDSLTSEQLAFIQELCMNIYKLGCEEE